MQKGLKVSSDLHQFIATCTNVTCRGECRECCKIQYSLTNGVHWSFEDTMEKSAAILSSGGWDFVRTAESTRTVQSNNPWPSSAAHLAHSQSRGRRRGVLHLSCSLLFYPEEAPLSVVDIKKCASEGKKKENQKHRMKFGPHGYKLFTWLVPTMKRKATDIMSGCRFCSAVLYAIPGTDLCQYDEHHRNNF